MSSECFSNDYTQDANCQGAWLLNESSGNALDSSPNGNNLVVTGATQGVAGQFGTAYSFNGIDNYLTGGDLDIAGSSVSICCWFNMGTANYQTIIVKGKARDAFSYYSNKELLKMRFLDDNVHYVQSTDNVPLEVLTHYGVTADGTNVNFYFDGVSDSGNPHSYPYSIALNNYNILVGARYDYEGGYEDEFSSVLDEIGLFSRALSSTEINDIMDNGLAGGAAASIMQPRIMRWN